MNLKGQRVMTNRRRKAVAAIAVSLGAVYVGLRLLSKAKKPDSIYDNHKEEKNPLEGKKVVFVSNDEEPENADGVKGHLEATGESEYSLSLYEKYVKRGLDVALSFGSLVALSPLMATIALAIKIEDSGPVFFTQKRIGQNKQYFKLHKFRTMKMSTPHDVPTHMLENPDKYITKVGKFIRRYSLDELPQIWDIFVGNMSFIGPRPGLWNQDLLTAERDKYGANDVKPGLSGWAQINGRDVLEIPEKAKLDGKYAREVSKNGLKAASFDLKCLIKTIKYVFFPEDVVEGGTGALKEARRGYTDGKTSGELIGHIGFGEPVEVDRQGKKKVLITGKDSYIGQSFIKYARENYEENFEINELDMTNESWKDADFSKYDIVYHVAGIAHADIGNVSNETKEKYYEVNTDLAIETAKKAKKDGVKEFIFMSSMIVYGDSAPYGQKRVIDENTAPAPSNFYGDSKLQADVAVRDFADDDFKVIVLRPPMVYGKGCKGNYRTLEKLAQKLPIFPNVDNARSMLYIGNLCEFLCQVMLIKNFKENSVVLIPQNKEWVKTGEMVKEIAKASGNNLILSKVLNPAVRIGGKMQGKIGGLVNKAFGNNCYKHEISVLDGMDYQEKL